MVQAAGNTAVSTAMGSSGMSEAASTVATVQQAGAIIQPQAARGSTNVYTSSYVSYSCEELDTLITSLEPTQTTSTGLATVAGLAGLFGRGSNAAAGASTLLQAQTNVTQQQRLQIEAAQGVAESKGC